MKFFILISFFGFYLQLNAQEIQYVKIDSSCEAGITQANNDIAKNHYELLSYGLIMRTNQEFHDFYVEYVRETYGVKMGDGGCVISDKIICYSETMENAILEKFGKDFFERAHKEAASKFDEKFPNQ